MSAYMLDKAHIDVLVGFAARAGGLRWWAGDEVKAIGNITSSEQLDQVGAMLWQANHVSVATRPPEPEPPKYQFRGPRRARSPVEVLKALDCYEYQSANGVAWPGSEAKSFCRALRGEATRRLPGYLDAAWEINDEVETALEVR